MAAKVTEKAVKERVKKILDIYATYNPLYKLNPMTFGYGESGHPDTLVLIGGKLLGIECKKDRNNHHVRPELKAKPNEVMQKRQREKIVGAGGDWLCVYNENFGELIDALDKLAPTYSEFFEVGHQRTLEKYREVL